MCGYCNEIEDDEGPYVNEDEAYEMWKDERDWDD